MLFLGVLGVKDPEARRIKPRHLLIAENRSVLLIVIPLRRCGVRA
jgi:hypothetical protein